MDFGTRGQRLWDSLVSRDPSLTDELNPAHEITISACYAADRVDDLEARCRTAEPTVKQGSGAITINPLYAEVRNQATLMTRLIAALRLPDVDSGKRPQHQGAMRGAQQPSTMSALDRARQRMAS